MWQVGRCWSNLKRWWKMPEIALDEQVFRAIADPRRREILERLRTQGPQRAGDLAACFPDVTRIAISKHLRVLHAAALVKIIDSDDARERRCAAG